MNMSTIGQKLKTIIEAVDMCCLELTQWEIDFIDSITIQIEQGKELSWKQSKTINRIWKRIE